MNKLSPSEFCAFQTLQEFIQNMNEYFGNKMKSLQLYQQLVSKTMFNDNKVIKKHLTLVSQFCFANREAIQTKDILLLAQPRLSFSDRIYVDIRLVLMTLTQNKEEVDGVWEYLTILSTSLGVMANPHAPSQEGAVFDMLSGLGKEGGLISDLMKRMMSELPTLIEESGLSMNPEDPFDPEMLQKLMKSPMVEKLLKDLTKHLDQKDVNIEGMQNILTGMMKNVDGGINLEKIQECFGKMNHS